MAFPVSEEPVNTRAESPDPNATTDPNLLELAESDPEEVVRKLGEEFERSWEDIRDLNEQWKVNLARKDGYLGARLDKVQDKQEAFIPLGAAPSIVGLNKAARLCGSLRSNLYADPAVPDVVPNRGIDADADKATFQSRILKDESQRLGYDVLTGDAFDLGSDYGSGFIEFYIDPEGRGPVPVRIQAHPDAQSADDPLLEQARLTGQPVEPQPPKLRYVTADGGLTDTRYGQPLRHQFLPKLCADLLTGRHVRFVPGTARDIWDATGLLIGQMVPLGTVKAAFPEVRNLPDDKLSEICSYRPTKAKDLVPFEQRRYLNQTRVSDTTLVFLLKRYELATAKYQKGAYIVTVGNAALAYAGEWWDTQHDEPLDLPATQIKQHHQHGNAYARGAMELLGPGNELLAVMLDSMLEHMDRFGDSKTFVPTTSNLRPEQLEAETHRYIPTAPGGMPVSEVIPDFPVVIEKMHARISAEMDAESGLQTAGQAIQASNVTSAKQFEVNLNQVSVLLSDLRQNSRRGIERGWLVMAQLIRAYYSIPQLLQWEGEDGAYHVKEWVGTDLTGTADVRIASGSFTGKLPEQKAALAQSLYLNDKVLTPAEYRRIVMSQFDPVLALQDDPHYQRIKRQIDRWLEGPPDGWVPPQPTIQGVGPDGQPVQGPPPPDPVLASIWAPLACDDDPTVAKTRLEELARGMAGLKYGGMLPAWRAPYDAEYARAKGSAQVMDAASSQKLQQDAQKTTEKLQQTEAKLAAKPSIGLTLKSAMELDQAQTIAFAQQAGIQLPATGGVMEPKLDPALELATQADLQKHQTDADVQKHRTTESAKIERERIQAAVKVQERQQPQAVRIVSSDATGTP